MTPARTAANERVEGIALLEAYQALGRIGVPSPRIKAIRRSIKQLISDRGLRILTDRETGKMQLSA